MTNISMHIVCGVCFKCVCVRYNTLTFCETLSENTVNPLLLFIRCCFVSLCVSFYLFFFRCCWLFTLNSPQLSHKCSNSSCVVCIYCFVLWNFYPILPRQQQNKMKKKEQHSLWRICNHFNPNNSFYIYFNPFGRLFVSYTNIFCYKICEGMKYIIFFWATVQLFNQPLNFVCMWLKSDRQKYRSHPPPILHSHLCVSVCVFAGDILNPFTERQQYRK